MIRFTLGMCLVTKPAPRWEVVRGSFWETGGVAGSNQRRKAAFYTETKKKGPRERLGNETGWVPQTRGSMRAGTGVVHTAPGVLSSL